MKRDKNLKITPQTHKLLKEYCEDNGLKIHKFVETVNMYILKDQGSIDFAVYEWMQCTYCTTYRLF